MLQRSFTVFCHLLLQLIKQQPNYADTFSWRQQNEGRFGALKMLALNVTCTEGCLH